MSKKESDLYKDRPEIRYGDNYEEYISELSRILKESEKVIDKDEFMRKRFLNEQISFKETHPDHTMCTGLGVAHTSKDKEKRICKCMNYYKKKYEKNCDNCKIESKWNNIGDIEIIDYEVPMKYKYENVGGIDLILKVPNNNDLYATEVKPKDNKETLVRMFAEILTYVIGSEYKPAICFFEGSKQMKDFKRFIDDNNEDIKYIMKYIRVFYVSIVSVDDNINNFRILPIEECKEIYGK